MLQKPNLHNASTIPATPSRQAKNQLPIGTGSDSKAPISLRRNLKISAKNPDFQAQPKFQNRNAALQTTKRSRNPAFRHATAVPAIPNRTAAKPKFQTSTASLGSRSVNQAVPKSVLPTSEPQAPVPISASQKTNSQAPQKFKPGRSNRKPNRQALLKLNLPPSSELGRAFLGRAQHPNRNQNAKFQGSQLAARQRSQQKNARQRARRFPHSRRSPFTSWCLRCRSKSRAKSRPKACRQPSCRPSSHSRSSCRSKSCRRWKGPRSNRSR